MKLARYSRDYSTTFLQFDWLRAVVFQLNLKYLHAYVKITNLSRVLMAGKCEMWEKLKMRNILG